MDKREFKEEFRKIIRDVFNIKEPEEKKMFYTPKRREYWKQYQQALLEVETLRNTVKEELYKEFMTKLGEPDTIERLRKENRKLRRQNKELKEIIKNNNIIIDS